jgi:LytS/YehU family sensor histidine kinase
MTLVENAVRHGVEPHPGEVLIQVTAHIANGDLHVLVHDDGAGVQDKVLGSGVGLRNLGERLHALYGARGGFNLHTLENGEVEAELWLPQFPLTPP